jgi:hypothetical protein
MPMTEFACYEKELVSFNLERLCDVTNSLLIKIANSIDGAKFRRVLFLTYWSPSLVLVPELHSAVSSSRFQNLAMSPSICFKTISVSFASGFFLDALS